MLPDYRPTDSPSNRPLGSRITTSVIYGGRESTYFKVYCLANRWSEQLDGAPCDQSLGQDFFRRRAGFLGHRCSFAGRD
jgi:hypothetical protein